jgi:hypothetical protein
MKAPVAAYGIWKGKSMAESLNVREGKYFVDHSRKIVREVVMIHDHRVAFITHHLDTGNSCGSASECKLDDFLLWAHHEATDAEIAGLQYRKKDMFYEELPFSHWDQIEAGPQISPL